MGWGVGHALSVAEILIAGCGALGTRLGVSLAADGHRVYALRRNPEALPPELQPVAADLARLDSLDALPSRLDRVFYTAAADTGDEASYRRTYVDGLRHLIEGLARAGAAPGRLFFTSSTAVYGQSDGSWVDEDSPTEPSGFRGRVMLEAEQIAARAGIPATVVRLGGLYGPDRTGLVDRVRAGHVAAAANAPHYTNRIHLDDAAGALRHLMGLAEPRDLFLGVDSEPADAFEVERWLAEALALDGAPGETRAAERTGVRRAGSKRCSNARLRASGYRFLYPSYREGYAGLLLGTG